MDKAKAIVVCAIAVVILAVVAALWQKWEN